MDDKTYSVIEAANESGYCRALVSRLCRRGEIGKKYVLVEANYHVFRLDEKDILILKARKAQKRKN